MKCMSDEEGSSVNTTDYCYFCCRRKYQVFVCLFLFSFSVLGIKPWHMVGKSSTTELYPWPLFLVCECMLKPELKLLQVPQALLHPDVINPEASITFPFGLPSYPKAFSSSYLQPSSTLTTYTHFSLIVLCKNALSSGWGTFSNCSLALLLEVVGTHPRTFSFVCLFLASISNGSINSCIS